MNELLTYLHDQLQNNNFFAGGAILMVLGGIAAACRKLPGQILAWIRGRFFIEIEVTIRDPAFWMFNDWLARHPYSLNRARWLSVRTRRTVVPTNDDEPGEKTEFILSPAHGTHWLFWRGRLLIVNRKKEDGNGSENIMSLMPNETFHIALMTRNRDRILDLLHDTCEEVHDEKDDRVTVLMATSYAEWREDNKRRPRPLNSVILRDGLMEGLIEDIRDFLSREEWYAQYGIPYRRGYLLYGPPGNGKSSAVMALASHLKMRIAILSLTSARLNDDDVRSLLSNVPRRSIVLVEDVDCVFEQRDSNEDKDNRVTFSGLLNAIDGIIASEGRILVMTTNHIEKLDPALIRPGRCDRRIEVKNPDSHQAFLMYRRFFPDSTDVEAGQFAQCVPEGTNMATLQGHLIQYQGDARAALTNTIRSGNEQEETNEAEVGTEALVGLQNE